MTSSVSGIRRAPHVPYKSVAINAVPPLAETTCMFANRGLESILCEPGSSDDLLHLGLTELLQKLGV